MTTDDLIKTGIGAGVAIFAIDRFGRIIEPRRPAANRRKKPAPTRRKPAKQRRTGKAPIKRSKQSRSTPRRVKTARKATKRTVRHNRRK
jgi:hypothetical protein